ncbi:MAG: 3-dehydroquinate dehydratase II, partial [uncultured Solirubrobacteraceae bacterium]
ERERSERDERHPESHRGAARREPRRAGPPARRALRRADLHGARAGDRGLRARPRPRGALLPEQPRGRLHRGDPPRPGPRRRPPAQPGGVDALRVVHPRRGRDRRPAGRGGPPLRRPGPRALPPRLRAHRRLRRDGLRPGRRGLPRGARAPARGAHV